MTVQRAVLPAAVAVWAIPVLEQATAASSRREGCIVGYINDGCLWQTDAGRRQPQSMNV